MSEKHLAHLPAIISDLFQTSRSEARRVIAQGGVRVNGAVVRELDVEAGPGEALEIQVGKTRKNRWGTPETETGTQET